jgi:hypothetical protein
VEGHDFVEVEGLARLINASVRFNRNQIVITLPGGADTPPAPASRANGFSPAFVKAHSKRRQSFGNGVPL